MTLKIYTDGSCLKNGNGGIGAVVVYKDEPRLKISEGFKDTTNNRMELTACISILEKLPNITDVELYTDSQYVIKGIVEWIDGWKRNNWKTSNKKTDVKNKDLWLKLDDLNSKHKIEWIWVKGHNGDKYNEMADKLATTASSNV